MQHPGWSATVGASSAAFQTYFFAGAGIKAAIRQRKGNPSIDDVDPKQLSTQAQAMFGDMEKYLRAATTQAVSIREGSKKPGNAISVTFNAQLGNYCARLADVAKDVQALAGVAASTIEVDKDRAAKMAIWASSIAQLMGPVVLSGLQKAQFLTIDSTCVAFAIGIQGLFKAIDPAANEGAMLEWFRQMMTFSLLKTAFLGYNAVNKNIVNRDETALYASAAVLAFSAMTFGGAIGKGLGAGMGGLVKLSKAGYDRLRGRDSPAVPDPEAGVEPATLETLEHLMRLHLDVVQVAAPELADEMMRRAAMPPPGVISEAGDADPATIPDETASRFQTNR
jgi:hypothetical protein